MNFIIWSTSSSILLLKKVNTNALLHVLVNFGLWSEAVELVKDYIEAIMMDKGAAKFDIKDSLASNRPYSQVLVPYNIIDRLLKQLSLGDDDMKQVASLILC